MTLVSVLMVVLNEEEHVEEAARSVLAQSVEDLELLVVDGGSTDATPEIVDALAAVDPRVRRLHNPGRIIPAGLNVGLDAARGSYVARLDGHSVWAPSVLDRGLAVLAGNASVAAVGGRRVGVAGGRAGRSIAQALSSRLGVGNSLYHYGTEAAETDHATCGLYRSEAVRAVGGWDESLAVNEDVDLDHRVRLRGWAIVFDPSIETFWRVQPDLARLFRQYRRYGRGKAEMVRKNGLSALRSRHLAPPVLVATTAAALAAAAGSRRRVALAPLAAYAAALGVAGMATHARRGDGSLSVFLTALAAMHYGWGLGFLEATALGSAPRTTSGTTT